MTKKQIVKTILYTLATLIGGFAIFCVFWNDIKWLERLESFAGYVSLPLIIYLVLPHYILPKIINEPDPLKKQTKIKLMRVLNVYHNCVSANFFALTLLHIVGCLKVTLHTGGHLYSFDYITGWICLIVLIISCIYGLILRKNTALYKLKHYKTAKLLWIFTIVHIACLFVFKYIISNFIS